MEQPVNLLTPVATMEGGGLSRLEILPGVWLDHGRAVFLEAESILAVADLHLGYTWAQRYNGQMLPLHAPDDLLGRLTELCARYQPRRLAILGDIVHQSVPVAEISEELSNLFRTLGAICGLKLILGNHDKKLDRMVANKDLEFLPEFETENFLLTHGNDLKKAPSGKFVIMGHEHPAIALGDGIASAKFPCFVISGAGSRGTVRKSRNGVLILPAFSLWSGGTNIRAHPFMSPLARRVRFHQAVAICGTKLLPVKLD